MSFLKIFKGAAGDKGTSLLDLSYEETPEKEEITKGDLSEVETGKLIQTTPMLMINNPKLASIPVIGVGGAGTRVLNEFAKRMKTYDLSYNTLGIDMNQELDRMEHISEKVRLMLPQSGTGKQYLRGQALAKKEMSKISDALMKYVNLEQFKDKHEIVFVIMGAGGFGVGASLEIMNVLKTMDKNPIPFLILPAQEENSRILFNAAIALYQFTYAPGNRSMKLPTICIDNNLFLDKNAKKNLTSAISAINERVGSTIADIVISTEMESHGYQSDINEFLELFRENKSIGVLTYLQSEEISTDLEDFYDKNKSGASSLETNIFEGTRSYVFIQAKEKQITSKEYRDYLNMYGNNDIFPKLNEIVAEEKRFAIRGLTTGLQSSKRIAELIEHAEEAKVTILNKTIENNRMGKGISNIYKLEGDEDIEVKSPDELDQ